MLFPFTLTCGTRKAWTWCLYNIVGMFQKFNVCFPLTKITKPSRKTKAHRKPACSKSSATPSSSGCPIENKPVFFPRLAMRYSSTHKSCVGRYMAAIYIFVLYKYMYIKKDTKYVYIYIYIFPESIVSYKWVCPSIWLDYFQPVLGTSGKGWKITHSLFKEEAGG